MKTIRGHNKERGFLAFGLGIALFALYGGIGAGVVANKEAERDVAQAPQNAVVAEVSHSGPATGPRVER